MSLLDMDQRLLELAGRVDVVYGPLVDQKEFPPDVDIALVEGAVGTADDVAQIRRIRARTHTLVALGDCAVAGNVPALRNLFGVQAVLRRAFPAATDPEGGVVPGHGLPVLLDRVRPIHEVVKVDVFVPGCPPPADAIYLILCALLDGRAPEVSTLTRFGR
jgi:NAD-reducing hydrogenase small subunit